MMSVADEHKRNLEQHLLKTTAPSIPLLLFRNRFENG
jgi:hypothetical protein